MVVVANGVAARMQRKRKQDLDKRMERARAERRKSIQELTMEGEAEQNNDETNDIPMRLGSMRVDNNQPVESNPLYLPLPIDGGWYSYIASKSRLIVLSDPFNFFIIVVILIAGLLVGVQTYPGTSENTVVQACDMFVLSVFVLEFTLKVIAEYNKPFRVFYGPDWKWNVFDFIIILVSLPVWGDTLGGGSTKLLRLLRLLRVMKLVRRIPQLQMIIMGLIGGLKSIAYILLLMCIIFYVYSVAGITMFRPNDEFHFGSLGRAMVTLFRAATLEDWTDIFYINYYGCISDDYLASIFYTPDMELVNNVTLFYCTYTDRSILQEWITVVYFISFIILSAFCMLALFIGAVTMSMTESMEAMKQEKEEIAKQKAMEKARAKVASTAFSSTRSRLSLPGRRTSMPSSLNMEIPKEINTRNKVHNPEESKGTMETSNNSEDNDECELDEDEVMKLQNLLDIAWGFAPMDEMQKNTRINSYDPGTFKNYYQSIANACHGIVTSGFFVNFVTLTIVIAAIEVGIQTYSWGESANEAFNILDSFVLAVFCAEVLLKTIACGMHPWRYFYYRSFNGWNIFDYIVVAGSFLPGAGSLLPILRLLRILRILKLLKSLPQLRIIVEALVTALSSISYIVLIICLVFYIFAILAMILFQENDPMDFGSLHIALFTLFRCSTLEDWTDVMYTNMYGCNHFGYITVEQLCNAPASQPWVAAIYFITFLVIGALVLLTLFIGVVTTSMEEASEDHMNQVETQVRLLENQRNLDITDETREVYEEMFKTLDIDGGGTLDDEELAFGFQLLDLPISIKQIKLLIANVDSRNFGEVDVAEFIVFMDMLRKEVELQNAKMISRAPQQQILENPLKREDAVYAEAAFQPSGSTRARRNQVVPIVTL